jgi:hypothetical protein
MDNTTINDTASQLCSAALHRAHEQLLSAEQQTEQPHIIDEMRQVHASSVAVMQQTGVQANANKHVVFEGSVQPMQSQHDSIEENFIATSPIDDTVMSTKRPRHISAKIGSLQSTSSEDDNHATKDSPKTKKPTHFDVRPVSDTETQRATTKVLVHSESANEYSSAQPKPAVNQTPCFSPTTADSSTSNSVPSQERVCEAGSQVSVCQKLLLFLYI